MTQNTRHDEARSVTSAIVNRFTRNVANGGVPFIASSELSTRRTTSNSATLDACRWHGHCTFPSDRLSSRSHSSGPASASVVGAFVADRPAMSPRRITMASPSEHPHVPRLKQEYAEGRLDRRDFLRMATLLGLSASAAYAYVAKVGGESLVRTANAATAKGGTIRIGMKVYEIKQPHIFKFNEQPTLTSQVVEYLSRTGHDNLTRPWLLERWEASPDLRSWRLHVRKNVKWRSGRDFTADDVIWNLKRVLDEKTGVVRPRTHAGLHAAGVHRGRGQADAPLGRQRHRAGRRAYGEAQPQGAAARHPRAPLPLPAADAGSGGERYLRRGLQRHRAVRAGRSRGREERDPQGPQELLGAGPQHRHPGVRRPRE